MGDRRGFLVTGLAGCFGWRSAIAQQRRSLADPLRVGVDTALAESGLARALQRAFGRDTGIAVRLEPGPALPLLEALERGECDAALSNAPDAELALERQGLVHDRRLVATGSIVLVGPLPKGKVTEMTVTAGAEVTLVLQRISAVANASGGLAFLSAGDGSGTHTAEQAMWRAARIAPATPWYVKADAGGSLAAQARARGAYALVERGSWLALGGSPLGVLVQGDPVQDTAVHVMRSFRANHPAGKIFVNWITSSKGARVVAGHGGYRAPRR